MPAENHTLSYLVSALLVARVFGLRFSRRRRRAAGVTGVMSDGRALASAPRPWA